MNDALLCLFLAFLSSSVGALFLFSTHHLSPKMMSLLYGSAAGIMMAACFFSLLTPALEKKQPTTVLAFLSGVFLLFLIDHLIPHESALTHEIEGLYSNQPASWRLLATMAIHNIVQGLALGICFTAENSHAAVMLSIGIILENLPEGAATAIPLLNTMSSPQHVFLLAEGLNFLEIPACLIGYVFALPLSNCLETLCGFAAGILLYTIIEEMLPDAWAQHNRPIATIALFSGFSFMMFLSIIL